MKTNCPLCKEPHDLSQCPRWRTQAGAAGYRLLPVALAPHIKDAIRASGHFMPESLWAAIHAAQDLVEPPAAPENLDFAPMEQRGTLVYLGRSGGFDVRDCPDAEKLAAFIVAACNAYAARAAAPERSETMAEENRYARELATALWEKHYKADAPQWKVLPDTHGALSQIDNMTTGLSRPAASSSAAPSDAWKALAEQAIAVLNRHIVPDGISDVVALNELYGIFDGPQYRAALGNTAKPSKQPAKKAKPPERGDCTDECDYQWKLAAYLRADAAPAASPAVLTDAQCVQAYMRSCEEVDGWAESQAQTPSPNTTDAMFVRALLRHITGQAGGEG